MITLKKFYLDEPMLANGKVFEPVVFEKGINLIIGTRSSKKAKKTQQEKMNSVGKSLLIEMINYCLLKDASHSRVTKIPFDVLPTEAYLCLDMEYETDKEIKIITVKRSRDDRNPIIISVDDVETEFTEKELEKAVLYLGHFFFNNDIMQHPSLRRLLTILIRDEKVGFDDILYPNGTRVSSYADIIEPHAYLFGFSLETIDAISKINVRVEKVKTISAHAKKQITSEHIKVSEVRSFINELDREVRKLDVATNAMKPSEGAKMLIDELNGLNGELELLITQKSTKETLARKIKTIPRQDKGVAPKDIEKIYDKYKKGLGTLVGKTFEDTLKFRLQIEEFEHELLTDKLADITSEISELTTSIELIDNRIATIYDSIGYAERVTDFRIAIQEQTSSHEKLNRLRKDYDLYEEKETEKKQLEQERRSLVNQIEVKAFDLGAVITQFENDLISIHEAIYDNAACHFDIKINQKAPKQYLYFDYRTDLDGGASSNRTKTFIYDSLLMLNRHTQERHPKFLIHDNVFAAVGRNDMVNALNYLEGQHVKGASFQYIVTLNTDEFEAYKSSFKFDTDLKKRKVLTREEPLLGQKYSELD